MMALIQTQNKPASKILLVLLSSEGANKISWFVATMLLGKGKIEEEEASSCTL